MFGVREDIERNAASRVRLHELVGRLSAADLDKSLGGDWTIKVALAHLAFWDHRQRASLQIYLDGKPLGDGTPPALEDSDEVVNEALVPLALRIESTAIQDLVIGAAEAIDTALERTTQEVIQRLASGPQDAIVRRWRHREEHLDQIVRAL